MWDDGTIREGALQGQLVLQACGACGALCHPPLPMCPRCQAATWDHRPASGKARLLSWLVSAENGRMVIVVELAEGVRFVSNLVEAQGVALREGLELELAFAEVDGTVLPVFRPVNPGAGECA